MEGSVAITGCPGVGAICCSSDLGDEAKPRSFFLVNFARWEPAHRGFNFRHPWKERTTLSSGLYSEAMLAASTPFRVSYPTQKHRISCMKLSSTSSAILKELVVVIRIWAKSPEIDVRLDKMSDTVQELQQSLKSLSDKKIGLAETQTHECNEGKEEYKHMHRTFVAIVQLVTVSSLLIVAARMENIVKVVNRLADKATNS